MSARTALRCLFVPAGSLVLLTGLAGAAPRDLDPRSGPGGELSSRLRPTVPRPSLRPCEPTTGPRSTGRTSRWRHLRHLQRRRPARSRGRGLLRRGTGRERSGRRLVRVERNVRTQGELVPGAGEWREAGVGPDVSIDGLGAAWRASSTRTSLSFARRRPASGIRTSAGTESRPSTSARRTSATPQSCSPTGRSSAPPAPRRTTASTS